MDDRRRYYSQSSYSSRTSSGERIGGRSPYLRRAQLSLLRFSLCPLQLVLISSIIDVANKVLKVTIPGSESIDIPLDPEETKLKGWKLFVRSVSSSHPSLPSPSLTSFVSTSASPTSSSGLLRWTHTFFPSISFRRIYLSTVGRTSCSS